MPFTALAQRAARTDRIIKGRLAGDAWIELMLLTLELSAPGAAAERARPGTI
jgi:hypothetical protein